MYPGPSGSAQNHKRGYCSDGVKQTLKSSPQNQDPPQTNAPATHAPPDWPQPESIFTSGTQFDPLRFLAKIREMYVKVVVEKASGEFLMEHEAFAALLARRTVVLPDGLILFKLFDLECSGSTPDNLFVVREESKYLRIDCLREGGPPAV